MDICNLVFRLKSLNFTDHCLNGAKHKAKNMCMCVSGFCSEKKNRYGRLALSFYFIKIFHMQIAFFTTFPSIFQYI